MFYSVRKRQYFTVVCIFPKCLQLLFISSLKDVFDIRLLFQIFSSRYCFILPPFPLFFFFPSLWYIFFLLKVNTILLCWWAIRSFDFRACTATFSISFCCFLQSCAYQLNALDYFPSSTWYLCISLSFQVTFLIFSVATPPRCQTFLGLHSYFKPHKFWYSPRHSYFLTNLKPFTNPEATLNRCYWSYSHDIAVWFSEILGRWIIGTKNVQRPWKEKKDAEL